MPNNLDNSSYQERLYQAVQNSKNLPMPNAFEQQHSEKLITYIRNEMHKSGGAISFKDYMNFVLYAPALGYYAAGSTKIGDGGDFITAPEMSPLFSHALANAILPALELIPAGEKIILEVGAGRGRMAADIIDFLTQKNKLPNEYWILELSADLRERQKQLITEIVPDFIHNVKWLDALPKKFSGVVLANELLDAMPVQLFQRTEEGINEVYVTCENDKFVFQFERNTDERLINRVYNIESEIDMKFSLNYISEINFTAEDWIKTIAEQLQKGIMILIDYGFPRHEYYHAQRNEGTLMCHYKHRCHADAFVYPGLQDITAHVDFTAMADVALEAKMNVIGYTNQANFLMGAGLLELAKKYDGADTKKQIQIASQIKKLTLPHEMGELFKVIGFSKNCEVSLPAFEFRDMRDSL